MSQSILEMAPSHAQFNSVIDDLDHLSREDAADQQFTEFEADSLQRDDAMAGGMIAIVLGFAFTVLLVLATGVNLWMATLTSAS